MPKSVDEKYKIPLGILFGSVAVGMIFLAKDMFKDKVDYNKTYDSLKFTANFFDQDTKDISKEITDTDIPRLDPLSKYIVPVVTNQFFQCIVIKQSLGILDILLDQKFFSQIPSKLELIIKAQKTDGINTILKFSLMELGYELKRILKSEIDISLKNYIDITIQKQVAELAFQAGNSESIMKIGDYFNGLPDEISNITKYASDSLSSIIFSSLKALIIDQSPNNNISLGNILTAYPQLILLKGLIESVFSYENFMLVDNFIKKQTASSSNNEEEFIESKTTKMTGMGTLTINTTPSNYAYSNIQEIAKLGASEFMLKRLHKYLIHLQKGQKSEYEQTHTGTILKHFSTLIHTLASFVSFSILKVTDLEEMKEIDDSITSISSVFGIGSGIGKADLILHDMTTDRAEKTLRILKNPIESKLKRDCSGDIKLSIDSYHLRKVSEKDKEMIHIPHLEFGSGKVYAIKGKIGSGKTTFLTDVAKCLLNLFESEGVISYPVHDGKPVPMIFCGSVPFSPPLSSLFEKLTYRLPHDYRITNQQNLENRAIELFTMLEQNSSFTKEKMNQKGDTDKLGLSTGQGKIVMLVGAILYKEYLNSPVLFSIDETLANLDTETTKLICNLIKDIFSDSIVISVDHQYGSNPIYEGNIVDIEQYIPHISAEGQEVAIIG